MPRKKKFRSKRHIKQKKTKRYLSKKMKGGSEISTFDDLETNLKSGNLIQDVDEIIISLINKNEINDGNINNRITDLGSTLIIYACTYCKSDTVQILLETFSKRIDITKQNNKNYTPLMQAVMYSEKAIIELLLNRGADLFQVHEADGSTLLHLAAIFHRLEIVKYLVLNNSNVNAINKAGKTPADVCVDYAENRKEWKDIVTFLIKNGSEMPESIESTNLIKEVCNKAKNLAASIFKPNRSGYKLL